MKLKVEGREDLVRDTRSHAIINTDETALEKARERAAKAAEKNKEFEDLKSDVQEIKKLLSQLMDRV